MAAALPCHAFSLTNFEAPESIVTDPETGAYYVSNINGDPFAKDGNGYISKIDPNGVVIQKFITAKGEEVLNAPKGLALIGKTLYVTDIDAVKGYDKDNGKQVVLFDFKPYFAKFLNDLTVDDEKNFYVTDMLADIVFKIEPKTKKITIVKQGPELGNPNGILFNSKTKSFLLFTWASGKIVEVGPDGALTVLKESLMNLDGGDFDNEGNLFVSSFQKGEIYKIPNYGRGELTTFLGGLTTPADISIDRKKNDLLIPSLNGNTVSSVPLKKTS
jgi:sugar lactone lactonase YvrE